MIACMLNFDLVSILSGTSIPTSFNILVKMFLHLYHIYSGMYHTKSEGAFFYFPCEETTTSQTYFLVLITEK